jgi:hypothetical protein
MIEVMEEEELANMRAHQEQFIQMRAAEIAEAQRMEEAERRRYEEKERRAAQVAWLLSATASAAASPCHVQLPNQRSPLIGSECVRPYCWRPPPQFGRAAVVRTEWRTRPHPTTTELTLCHLRQDWAHPCHICAGTGLPLPHLRRDWAHPCHICAGTGLTPATSAPGLGSQLPHVPRDWVRICTGP